jgi:hypothetical protein
VQVPGLGEEVTDLLPRIVEAERLSEVEVLAVEAPEADRSRFVDGAFVEHRPKHRLPRHEVVAHPAPHLDPPGHDQAEGRYDVLDEFGEGHRMQGRHGPGVGEPFPGNELPVVDREVGRLTVNLEAERRQP